MSYDLSLVIDTGGPEPADLGMSFNMTSNVAPMWRKAGVDLALFHGMLAGETVAALRMAVAEMSFDLASYEAMNPENGWGNAAGCLDFLKELLAAAERHPAATWSVWR